MAKLFLELFSEEIPARMQEKAAADLLRLVTDGLKDAGLEYADAQAHVTPRRLMVAISGLPKAQPDVREERRGPKADAPEKAVAGFLGSVGLTRDQVETRETPKGPFLFAVIEHKGRPSAEVLPELVAKAILALPWPKSMRWSTNQGAWVRPLHSIIALFDGTPLAGGLSLGRTTASGAAVPVTYVADPASVPDGVKVLAFGDTTRGHRFLAPEPFAVRDFAGYKDALRAAKVVLDRDERRATIVAGLGALAAGAGLVVKDDPGLLSEVTGLVEWPVPLMGRIDDAFMDVPPEVLTTSMRSHQKYFSLETADGALAPRFIAVANIETADDGARIIAGNERVLRARLSDAKFFWDQDRAKPLADRVADLGARIFHARLGTDLEKVDRVRALAADLAGVVPGADRVLVDRAALLAKADLVTGMVGEFPELQGLMGRYYALHDGEDAVVADAIRDHYSPVGPTDACPTAPVSLCVALADKLDTLIGFWLIDEKPTGSKDPFALRRAALGVIRLIVENGLRLSLTDIMAAHAGRYSLQTAASAEQVLADLMAFIADRLKVQQREQGVRHDLIAAIFDRGGEDDLVRLLARVAALSDFVGSDAGANMIAAYRRAMNIVRIEEKKDGAPVSGDVDPALFAQDEERTLAGALGDLDGPMAESLKTEDYAGAMAGLAGLRGPVDAFFDKVTVNADDAALRANRLRLLSRIGGVMGAVADFSKIEG